MDITQAERKSASLATRALTIAVVDVASYEATATELLDVKAYLKVIDGICDPSIEAGHQAHKAALEVKAKLADPAKAFERAGKAAMVTWRQAEDAKLAAIAREAEAAARKAEEDARVADAAAAEKAGEPEAAAAILEMPSFVPPVIAPRAAPKMAGVAMRDNWKAQVTDLRALVLAVAQGKADVGLLLPNLPAINARAKSEKANCRLPGVRVFNDPTMSLGGR